MVWSSLWPDGSKSVAANTTPGLQNTAYIETTMNLDHFWNIGDGTDGYHDQVNLQTQTSDLTPALGGVIYAKAPSATNTAIQGFWKNATGTAYQFIPTFLTGTISITSTSTYTTIVAIPAHSYGQVYLFTDTDTQDMTFGYFKSSATLTEGYSSITLAGNSQSTYSFNVRLANGDQASDLNLKARLYYGASATYQYRIMYWAT
jgi:hypothetical protein